MGVVHEESDAAFWRLCCRRKGFRPSEGRKQNLHNLYSQLRTLGPGFASLLFFSTDRTQGRLFDGGCLLFSTQMHWSGMESAFSVNLKLRPTHEQERGSVMVGQQ